MMCSLRGLTVGIVLFAVSAAASLGWCGEPILERLEKSIRQQVERNEPAGPVAPQPGVPVAPQPGVPKAPVPEPIVPAKEPPAPAEQGRAEANGKQPGFLGVVTDDKTDRGRGVRVLSVRPQGPGDTAGVKADDLIVAIAGTRVRQQSDFADMLSLFPPGEKVLLDVQRDGKTIALKVTLGRRPEEASRPEDLLPKPPTLNPPPGMPDDKNEIDLLKRRVTELEQRVADLEQALGDLLNRK